MKKPVGRPRKIKGLFDDGPAPALPPPAVKRKPGRPKGARNTMHTVATKRDARLRHSKYMLKYFGHLTDAEIKKLKPLELFAGLAFIAVKTRDHMMLREVAKDWAPYEHARKNENVNIGPEELRRIADLARSEAAKRGIDPDDPRFAPGGTGPH
jgi:hypothetical protein